MSAWYQPIDSYGTPSSVATICGKTVLWACPWLCAPVYAVTRPSGAATTRPVSGPSPVISTNVASPTPTSSPSLRRASRSWSRASYSETSSA